MSIEVKVPVLPESVADATVVTWHKNVGDSVSRDETIVDLETDKVVLEVPSPSDGVIAELLFNEGDIVLANQVLAKLSEDEIDKKPLQDSSTSQEISTTSDSVSSDASPAVRRLLAEHNLDSNQITGSGKGGRLVKEDVLNFLKKDQAEPIAAKREIKAPAPLMPGEREERRVPMSRLRAKIAERLVQAQHSAAMLTTFNEVNLQAVMDLRKQYKDAFEKKHGVKLGFMSFFTKAVTESLKRFPAVNASIDGDDIVYHGYYDVGIAVSTERGLVVPVVRDTDKLSMAEIELSINDCAGRARTGKLGIEEMQGGTFTITNGGVFGSLLATPIINPPQTGILGMHKIEQRPVVEQGAIVIRPMMYVALSYDHRLIDGKESVQFLVSVKELLEDPSRLLLEV
jgi:2-oxoglutarate dehydrogenase E2 component (dihydrolipoamide succinyltransferase)